MEAPLEHSRSDRMSTAGLAIENIKRERKARERADRRKAAQAKAARGPERSGAVLQVESFSPRLRALEISLVAHARSMPAYSAWRYACAGQEGACAAARQRFPQALSSSHSHRQRYRASRTGAETKDQRKPIMPCTPLMTCAQWRLSAALQAAQLGKCQEPQDETAASADVCGPPQPAGEILARVQR
jgi:hypothetical protein